MIENQTDPLNQIIDSAIDLLSTSPLLEAGSVSSTNNPLDALQFLEELENTTRSSLKPLAISRTEPSQVPTVSPRQKLKDEELLKALLQLRESKITRKTPGIFQTIIRADS